MSNEIWQRRRQQLEKEARAVLLKLFEHMGSPASAQFPLDEKRWVRIELKPDPGHT